MSLSHMIFDNGRRCPMLARMPSGILLRLIPSALLIGFASAAPTIEVGPAHVIEGEPVAVRITGLEADQAVVLHATAWWERYPSGMESYRSRAIFRADRDGVVDLGRDVPQPGSSYAVADPAGIFWSMVADRLASPPSPALPELDAADTRQPARGEVRLALEVGGSIAARQSVCLAAAPGIVMREIREKGVTGVFATGATGQRRPAVIVLGGSEGGLFTARSLAPLLASQGCAVLGLGYFRGDEPDLTALPPTLEHIPVETLAAARTWLAPLSAQGIEWDGAHEARNRPLTWWSVHEYRAQNTDRFFGVNPVRMRDPRDYLDQTNPRPVLHDGDSRRGMGRPAARVARIRNPQANDQRSNIPRRHPDRL